MTLDATPKGTSANAYCTEAEATAYLSSERLYDTLWTAATTQTRERALIWATFVLDTSFDWEGNRRTIEQSLRWPRAGIDDADYYWLDYDTLPALLKKATATQALKLLERDRSVEPTILGLGIEQAAIGPMKVVTNQRVVTSLITDDVINMLEPLGRPKGGSQRGDKVMKTYRS